VLDLSEQMLQDVLCASLESLIAKIWYLSPIFFLYYLTLNLKKMHE
jgi:hypothetical protein